MAYDPANSFLINSLPLNANQFEADSEALNSVPSILVWNTELNAIQRINTKTNAVLNQFNSDDPGLVYIATLDQSGVGAPVATIIKNTLGVVPVWSYDDVGRYVLTAEGVFTSGKTRVIAPQPANDPAFTGDAYSAGSDDEDTVYLTSASVAGATGIVTAANGRLNEGYSWIEIRVYP